jgi:hypothetical protein
MRSLATAHAASINTLLIRRKFGAAVVRIAAHPEKSGEACF